MIVDSSRKRILCFGDSNTWARDPEGLNRHTIEQRWTGVLQNLLGDTYDVIEEGLGGRTVNQDDNSKIGKNGRTYLTPCVESHVPLDIILIMLGTNDLKAQFNSTPESITAGLSLLVNDVYNVFDNNGDKRPRVILIAPIHIDVKNPDFDRIYGQAYDFSCGEISQKLSKPIRELCSLKGLGFLDAHEYSKAGADGLHLSADAHHNLAKAVYSEIIKEL